ncbi:MAG TPA: sigma-E factor regulatory protein RseB domain-containing protein [Acetivibrio sp.]|uniref:LolA family protein n=1 Tax=Acetivibrio sp. TaxID=1872092 RepID=UPI002C40634D|nr:sigma-E factor regulatory protein RseB domain-containing protein [Acetivibrio sp.]HOM03304.1 sigma-E factor regulatory protein RseB domain-containing protein [Acetivibrio sp.]
MDNNEKKLSEYIDKLNAEKKPKEHDNPMDSPELEELMDTVRKVRSLREPALPDADYPKKLARAAGGQLRQKSATGERKWAWLAGTAAIAAVAVLVLMLNFVLYPGRTDIVYAMEQAYKEVGAYHGILSIVETNLKGEETLQAMREVWSDNEGRYFVKELEGFQKGVVTVNNGDKKWQVCPNEKKVYVFSAFPDPYRFTLELGNEINDVKDAAKIKPVGEDTVAGRRASVFEILPKGGEAYRIWIDKETKLPLQRQRAMTNAIQYRITYTSIEFSDNIPGEILAYDLPEGFEEIDNNPELLVNNIEEAGKIAGFTPKVPENVPDGYAKDSIAVAKGMKATKLSYVSENKKSRVIILQEKATDEFKPASTAVLGKVGNNTAEIQSPVQQSLGVLDGGILYSGMADICSIRWQESGFEYAVIGDAPMDELVLFIESIEKGPVEIPSGEETTEKPQIKIPVDLGVEENEQKSVDAGHSPWKLDPVYVAQVFVSLKISPEGIEGDYPVNYEDMKVIKNNGIDAIVEISGNATPVRRVYLKKLIRQDSTGIWTVIGYDPVA